MKTVSLDNKYTEAFTLIELAIVLVIIGLLISGVLAGKEIITQAGIRAQISQINKYNLAANTFRSKYNYFPGDIKASVATQFGFVTRGTPRGEGDGNGLIEGYDTRNGRTGQICQGQGETATFWVDLTSANMIAESFTLARNTTTPTAGYTVSATSTPYSLRDFWPEAQIGGGNYVMVWSGGTSIVYNASPPVSDGWNYFSLSLGPLIDTQNNGGAVSSLTDSRASIGITVQQAYGIDSKIDDGLPQSGNVFALLPFSSSMTCWSQPNISNNSGCNQAASTASLAATSSTCYDNNSTNGATRQYSLSQNNGEGKNCGLTLKFQ